MTLRSCRLLWLYSLALVAYIHKAAAIFDPNAPGYEENFFPSEADPKGKITCQGPPPSFRIPRAFGLQSDPNTWTLQEICAKPQYGGKGIRQHAGGYCYHYSTPDFPPYVAFDSSPSALASPVLQNPRLQVYCLLRCFCDYGITRQDALDQIKVVREPAFTSMVITLDEPQLTGMDRGDGFSRIATYTLPRANQLEAQQWQASHDMEPFAFVDYIPVSLNPANSIECDGNVPPIPLTLYDPRGPSYGNLDWRWEPGQAIHKLCANALDGGSYIFNVGAYCHRVYHQDKVWFSDDITPNLAMTWQNWAQTHTLRAYCFEACSCGPPEEDDELLEDKITIPGVFEFLNNRAVGIGSRGNVDIFVKQPGGSTLKFPLMQSSNDGNRVSQGACENDPKRFCPVDDWPENILGPSKPTVPVAPPPINDLVHLDQCGKECNDQSDCGSFDKGCRCIAPKTMPQYIPLDPIFPYVPELPKGRCLTLTQDLIHAVTLNQIAMRKREEELLTNESQIAYVGH